MNVIVISEYIATDPNRYTFYNIDTSNHYIKLPIIGSNGMLSITFLKSLFQVLKRIRQTIRNEQVDVIFSENPRVGLLVNYFLKVFSCDSVRHILWNFNISHLYTGLKLKAAKSALGNNTVLVVYSNHERNVYSTLFSLEKRRVFFKYYSAPYLDDPVYLNMEHSATAESYIVAPGFSGRDFKLLEKVTRYLPDLHFKVLAYPEALRGIYFGSNVEIIHSISEMEYCRIIADASVCFIPLNTETTANGQIGIVQALCFRTALVTNFTPGTTDYLIDQKHCVIVDSEDIESVLTKIRDIYSNRKKRQELESNGYVFAKSHFSVDKDSAVIIESLNAFCISKSINGKGCHSLFKYKSD